MRSLRYLNTILTTLAVLLALQLWTTWSGGGVRGDAAFNVATPTHAQVQTRTTMPPPAAGIPDAAGQRKEMIDLLKRQTQQMDELTALLRSGSVRVKVEAPAKE